jgi:hypothetical protein
MASLSMRTPSGGEIQRLPAFSALGRELTPAGALLPKRLSFHLRKELKSSSDGYRLARSPFAKGTPRP